MYTNRSIRPYAIGTPVSRSMFAIIRVLIGSYFLAAGTGLILDPSSRTLFDGVLPADTAALATTAYLYITAFMIMVGKGVRPAALLLSIYIFWSAFIHFELGLSPEGLSSFWRDMALLGAVLLVAVTEPGGSDSFKLWRKGVISPRRVVRHNTVETEIPVSASVARPERSTPTRAAPMATARDIDASFEAEPEPNLFGDLWEQPLVRAISRNLQADG